MELAEFDFDLPRDLIAQHPARPRDSARLLVVGTGLDDRRVRDLPEILRPGDVMVFNDTRVIPTRLSGRRDTARIEATLHRREAPDTWRAFARPARRLESGDRIVFAGTLAAEVVAKGSGGEVTLRFDRSGDDLLAALEAVGAMPLPPYIKRPKGPDPRDREDYQTVFARRAGAVAAPTAALHFTEALLADLDRRGIERLTATLHVGAGTFLPIKSANIAGHRMHGEICSLDAATAERVARARAEGRRIVAVGTTVLRLLESAAARTGRVCAFEGETDLFVTPGYRFRVVDALMTNFHLPRSTLFVLVAAFAGLERMRAAYAHAVRERYRFYSYGDATLLFPEGSS